MWYTGVDPMSGKPVQVARHLRDRKLQRALMQFFKPENWFEVRDALIEAGRTDLIGYGRDALIPANPPKEAVESRRVRANPAARSDHSHSVANPAAGEVAGERKVPPQVTNRGYRPGRQGHRRRPGRETIG